MRAIFCGNLDYDARQSDVERLFRRYGRIDRVDMKSVFVRRDDPLAYPHESLNFANSETRAKGFTCVSYSGHRKVATEDVRRNDPFNWPREALGNMVCFLFLDRFLSRPNGKISRAFGFLRL